MQRSQAGSWSFCVTEFCTEILGNFYFCRSNFLIHSFNNIALLHSQNTDSPASPYSPNSVQETVIKKRIR